jgi:hypothetical protein
MRQVKTMDDGNYKLNWAAVLGAGLTALASLGFWSVVVLLVLGFKK